MNKFSLLLTFGFFVMLLWIPAPAAGQSAEPPCLPLAQSEEAYCTSAEEMPNYGGEDYLSCLWKRVMAEFRLPEDYWEREDFQSDFIIEFIVDKEGRAVYPNIYRNSERVHKTREEYTGADIMLLDIVRNMPPCTPGRTGGENVAVKLQFSLRIDPAR